MTTTMYRPRKLDDTVQFYEKVLGFTNGPRRQFNFPGAWLYSIGHPVLHLKLQGDFNTVEGLGHLVVR
jgi:hypothetical protein